MPCKVTQKWTVKCSSSRGYIEKNGTCSREDPSFCNSISLLKGVQQLNGNSASGLANVIAGDVLSVKFAVGNGKVRVRLLPQTSEKIFEGTKETVDLDLAKMAGSTYSVLASRGESRECSVLSNLKVGCPVGSKAINGDCEYETDINVELVQGISVGVVLLLCAGLFGFFIWKNPGVHAWMRVSCLCTHKCVSQKRRRKLWWGSCRWSCCSLGLWISDCRTLPMSPFSGAP